MKEKFRTLLGTAAIAALVCLLTIGLAGAWDQAHLDQLLQLRHCPMCDLSGADLSGKNLSGHNLWRANLSNANLSDANLSTSAFVEANLSGADLRNANLTRANFYGANLSGADLNGATLDGAIFNEATSWFDDAETCATPSIGGCFPECAPHASCY